jgi:hypothetical protein
MKLTTNYLSNIEGIGITQSISFVFFFSIFILILYYVLRTKTSYYKPISEMPLEDNESEELKNDLKK